MNISSYPGTSVPGLFFHSRAVIFKSGCFVQKYWSGTVTRNENSTACQFLEPASLQKGSNPAKALIAGAQGNCTFF